MKKYASIALVMISAGAVIVACDPANQPDAPATTSEKKVEDVKPTSSAPAGLSDGTYLVGTDIKSGTYKTPGPADSDIMDSCYWSVNKDDLGEDIIANNNITGPARITVKTGRYLELSGGCHWSRVVSKKAS